jgi:hypothetical protein
MKEEDIVKQAHERFALLEEQERDNRALWLEDVKFANGDSDNGWQWEQTELNERAGRPAVTVNKVKQHNRQITNDGRENKVSIKIKAEGNGAHAKTADILQGLIRNIEKRSTADTAYDTAYDFAVDGGIGYWYVTTDYIADDSFEQEILIKPIPNPLNVYLCEGDEFDGSDAPFGFIFKDYRKEEFKAKYPKAESENNITWGDYVQSEWQTKDTIRVAHYYCIKEIKDKLYALDDGTTALKSELKGEDVTGLKSRDITRKKVMCYEIASDKILNEYEWIGTSIPIVPCKGEEKVIDGEVCRKGNTRLMKDSQRMYNYELSCEIEFKRVQGKDSWIGPAEAFAGHPQWADHNIVNHAFLPYNHVDDAGNPLPPPQRVQPPLSSAAYMEGMRIASEDMQAVSGQFDAQMGQNVNQQSGKALLAVQNRGLVSTFNFIDNKARALQRTGKIILELIPKVYDVEAVKRIIGEDEKEEEVQINPDQKEAYRKVKDIDGKIKEIFNPGVGRYAVDVQVGSNYGTRRQESFNALTEVATRSPDFMKLAGDIYFEMADFPMADKIAERYEKALPPELREPKDEDDQPQIPPEVQRQIADSEAIIKQLDETVQAMQKEIESKDLEREKIKVEKFNATTNRLKVMPELPQDETGRDIYTAELDDVNDKQFQALAQAMTQIAQTLEQVTQLAVMAAAPRKSELQLDQNGMPTGSVSYPMPPPQQGNGGMQ